MKKTVNNIDRSRIRSHGTQNTDRLPDGRKRLLWTVLFLVIAAATIWAVTSHSKAFSPEQFASYIGGVSKIWLAAAVLCVFGFIIFEGEAVITICRALDCKTGHRQGLIYSASDIYFSGITPSASGGQPACAYFMIRDGIPASTATAALLINLALYTLSIIVISLAVVILQPSVFLSFGLLSKILIAAGYIIQCLLAAFFILLLVKSDLLHRICRGAIRFLCRIRLVKGEAEKLEKLDSFIGEYTACSQAIRGHKKELWVAFVFNILQRIFIILVPVFVFLASGGAFSEAAGIWAVQSYVVVGSNAIPIPGAMGVSDYIMLDGYGRMMDITNAVNLELLSRSISFYICIVLCGAIVLVKYLTQKRTGS